jgi:hypothetical protein
MGRISILATILAVVVLIQPAYAVVIYKKGSTKPITGHLIRQSDAEVVLRDDSGAAPKELVIPRGEIEDLIETVSAERLMTLDPARPQEYREYAEELAEKKLDPEARLMAVRLFQIAAWLDPKTGRGALLGLVSVARPGEEEARFRAAAFLFDPRHDKALLGQTLAPAARGKKDDDPVHSLLEALRQLRCGRGPQARAALAPAAVSDELEAHRNVLSREEFLAACSAKELSHEQLRKVIELELALDNRLSGRPETRTQTTLASWNDAVISGSLSPLQPLQFDRLTPFDPRDCVFRLGKWQRPMAGK